jgi:hypothetical protein
MILTYAPPHVQLVSTLTLVHEYVIHAQSPIVIVVQVPPPFAHHVEQDIFSPVIHVLYALIIVQPVVVVLVHAHHARLGITYTTNSVSPHVQSMDTMRIP